MKMMLRAVAIALGLSAVPALAQGAAVPATAAAPAISRGDMVFSADGHMIGRVDRVNATSVSVIYDDRYVNIPTTTLSAKGKDLATSLKRAEVSKL